ncbi:MAG TPA: 50S ribosomal protein L24 [Candidatus Paceibacterota bacterium]|jgi:large subunit ribosomal protein L24|nr:50S ribosomal protein L24 [Candidatus Paceibacterota bacterium]
MKMKLKKGDSVVVVSGKDKGKTGTIVRAFPSTGQVVVEGVGMVKRHLKGGRGAQQSGSIVERPRAIDASNVMFVDKQTKKGTRKVSRA